MGWGGANGGPPSDAPVQGKVGVENFLRAAGNRRRGTFTLSAGSAPLGRAMMYVAGYSWLATLAWTLFDLLRHFGTTLCFTLPTGAWITAPFVHSCTCTLGTGLPGTVARSTSISLALRFYLGTYDLRHAWVSRVYAVRGARLLMGVLAPYGA